MCVMHCIFHCVCVCVWGFVGVWQWLFDSEAWIQQGFSGFDPQCEWPSGARTRQRVQPVSNPQLIYSWSYLPLKELTELLSTPGGRRRKRLPQMYIKLHTHTIWCHLFLRLYAVISLNSPTWQKSARCIGRKLEIKKGSKRRKSRCRKEEGKKKKKKNWSNFTSLTRTAHGKRYQGKSREVPLILCKCIIAWRCCKVIPNVTIPAPQTSSPFPSAGYFNAVWTCRQMIPK